MILTILAEIDAKPGYFESVVKFKLNSRTAARPAIVNLQIGRSIEVDITTALLRIFPFHILGQEVVPWLG